ncbi:MAG: hypothetical protein RB292_03050 [Patescibacteria group bacterium]|jgi:hypothetical protein|nr:hypothetical protein [Patescibacteria group bacterium]
MPKDISGYEKNLFIFTRLFIENSSFRNDVDAIDKKWQLRDGEKAISMNKFIELNGNKDLDKFDTDIDNLTKKYGLGSFWNPYIFTWLVTGKLFVPSQSVNISVQKNKAIIEFNAHTTSEEVKNALLPSIKNAQEKLWPNINTPRTTRETLDNLYLYIEGTDLKRNGIKDIVEGKIEKISSYKKMAEIIAQELAGDNDVSDKEIKKIEQNLRKVFSRYNQKLT